MVYSVGEKSSFEAPHTGQAQSWGTSSNGVPGATPLSGSPVAGSYSQPHTSHLYFFMVQSVLIIWFASSLAAKDAQNIIPV